MIVNYFGSLLAKQIKRLEQMSGCFASGEPAKEYCVGCHRETGNCTCLWKEVRDLNNKNLELNQWKSWEEQRIGTIFAKLDELSSTLNMSTSAMAHLSARVDNLEATKIKLEKCYKDVDYYFDNHIKRLNEIDQKFKYADGWSKDIVNKIRGIEYVTNNNNEKINDLYQIKNKTSPITLSLDTLRIEVLEKELKDVKKQLAVFLSGKNYLNEKKPHKCPLCDGYGWL
jgi:chromosome segregation ATPase